MLSYTDLYDLLRKEKYNDILQQLPKNFLIDICDYLAEKKNLAVVKEDEMFADAVDKAKKQYENSISIFKELIRIRKKKLLSLVFVATETGMMKRDFENMLPFEKEMFDKLVKAFEEGDKQLAKQMNGKKDKPKEENKMVMFNQDVEQFVDISGNLVGPFKGGQLVNIQIEIAEILVSSGKAAYIDNQN